MKDSTKNNLIAKQYSMALSDLAKDGSMGFEDISKDLKLVSETLLTSPDLNEFLINQLVSSEDKKDVLEKVFGSEINPKIKNFLKVLIDKERFDIFNDVVEVYNGILDEKNNISRIEVTSAVKMSENSALRLKSKLEEKLRKTVVLDLTIRPEIIAGLVIKIGDNVVDMSLKHKLEDLSKVIAK